MLNKLFTRAKNNHLIKSSAVLFIGSIVANFGSYLFQLFMGRMLSVQEYGELQSLASIFGVISLPAASLSLVVMKYAAHYSEPSELGKTKALLKILSKKFTYIGGGIFFILIILSGRISVYLQIKEPLKVIIISLIFIFIFLVSINKGILQGLQKFKELSVIACWEAISKLLFAILLVWLGWQVYGAIGAFVISSLIGYFYSFLPLNKSFIQAKAEAVIENNELKDLAKYSLPVFFSTLGIALLFSLDIILVKHYFTPELAGMYVGMAILGRIIYYASGPIAAVLFPISAKQHKNGENYRRSFILSLIIVLGIGIAAALIFFIFPKLIIFLLLGDKYLSAYGYLGWYGLVMVLLSLINLTVNFLLSIQATRAVYLVLAGAGAQFLAITFWHNNILQIILDMGIVMIVILAGLGYYYKLKVHKVYKVHKVLI